MLDPALMRPGRLDRKIEIPLPNEHARMEILKIHAAHITKHGDIDYEAIVKLAENFNGADLRNVCTEAGMFAIRDERDYIVQVGCVPGSDSMENLVTVHVRPCLISRHRMPAKHINALVSIEAGVFLSQKLCVHKEICLCPGLDSNPREMERYAA